MFNVSCSIGGWRKRASVLGAAGLLAVAFSPGIFTQALNQEHFKLAIIAFIVFGLGFGLVLQLARLIIRQPSHSHSWKSVVYQFNLLKSLPKAKNLYEELLLAACNPELCQKTIFKTTSLYEDLNTFRANETLRQAIQLNVTCGESSFRDTNAKKIQEYELLSYSKDHLQKCFNLIEMSRWQLESWNMLKGLRKRWTLRKRAIISTSGFMRTKDELEYGTLEAHLLPTVEILTCPLVAYRDILHKPTSLYIQAVFTLAEPDIDCLEASDIWDLFSFFYIMEKYWEYICDDIERGRIWLPEGFKMSREENQHINQYLLTARAKRAAHLRKCYSIDKMHGLINRIWPSCAFAFVAMKDPLTACIQIFLNKAILGPDFPIFSNTIVSAESILAINVEQPNKKARFALLINDVFYEFLPVDIEQGSMTNLLIMEELILNNEYEMVITTKCGHVRYRTNCVVKPVDVFKSMPLFEFCFKLTDVVDYFGEKTCAKSVENAIIITLQKFKEWNLIYFGILDFTMFEKEEMNRGKLPNYKIFLEINRKNKTEILNVDDQRPNLSHTLDKCLCHEAPRYSNLRRLNQIGKLNVEIVSKGTFAQLWMDTTRGEFSGNVLRDKDCVIFLKKNVKKL